MPQLCYRKFNDPSSTCCSQLANVVQSSPQCLCSLLNNNGPSLGITINQTLALSLPGACKVQTPPISQCKAATAPTTSAAPPTTLATPPTTSPIPPATSPADSSNDTPEPALTPSASEVPSSSGTGSKTVPSTEGTSDGSIIKAPLPFMLFVFFIMCSISAAVSLGIVEWWWFINVVNINQTLALSLLGACHVQTPPVSRSNVANNGPTIPPVGSPADSSDDTPETPNTFSMPRHYCRPWLSRMLAKSKLLLLAAAMIAYANTVISTATNSPLNHLGLGETVISMSELIEGLPDAIAIRRLVQQKICLVCAFDPENLWQLYDPLRDLWITLPVLPSKIRHLSHFGVVSTAGKLFVLGGGSDAVDPLTGDQDGSFATNEVWSYDPVLRQWAPCASMLVPRAMFACCV
ncbi:hypothetical protein GH714_036934 [Hevea brasiliensis]|uniref:Bifunctional inhibitor/plant lipid transfer protein/seed storage helical domain-containing protein n=1 Tax=Hevea brasiliensis TaxID=3981 RepID=A0A6A6MNK4_HEVBR|nr:hypothetical protein GH714_036934 [Hevea brasiliensis]